MRYLWALVVAVGQATAQGPVILKTSANDDLPHQTARLAPLFAAAQRCIPKSKELTLGLDVFEGELVACAQVLTRQGGSVFLDPVSYACWNVDVATGKLALRADKGRAFFACQDGCPSEVTMDNGSIAYDGTRIAFQDETSVKVFEREADGTRGRLVSTITPIPDGLEATRLGGVYLAGMFVSTLVFDDTGRQVAKLPVGDIHVFDERRAIVVEGKRATVFDVTTKQLQRHGLADAYTAGPVAHGGRAFALVNRTLVVLDAKLRRERSVKLATCAK